VSTFIQQIMEGFIIEPHGGISQAGNQQCFF